MLSEGDDDMRLHWMVLVWTGCAWAQDVAYDTREQRQVVLFQTAPAELEDRYRVDPPNARLVDLPGAPLLGSCAFPEAEIERVDYPRLGLNLSLGETVDLWVRDARLGEPFQQAQVAWRQLPTYGLQLAGGQTLPWQPGSDWAEVVQRPESYPGLELTGQWDQALVVRCAIPGPSWQAIYHAIQRGDQMDINLQAMIQIPSGQNWGDTQLTLSAEVGRSRPGLRMEMAVASDSVGTEQVADGLWRYQLADSVLLDGGQQFTQQLWQASTEIDRVHRISAFVSARSAAQQSLSAQRVWTLTNTEQAGLGRAMPAGSIRINETTDSGYPLTGTTAIPALAPGAEHSLMLGPSLGVSGRLERVQMAVQGARVESTWRLTLTNSQSEAVDIELDLQVQRDANLTGSAQRITLASDSSQSLTLRLSEPRR